MFVDEVVVEVYGGRGGNGMASYRREKYVEHGGPWGGNGGHGGHVIFVGEEGKNTLFDLRYQRHIKADHGVNGQSKGMHGKNATPKYIRVPLGTIVFTEDKSKMLGEITHHDQELIVARGGKGGRGNIAFATPKNPAPDYAENGDPGQHLKLKVELKVLADIGIIGYPSVGKSTFISVVSNAKPKIASYPFTTLSPQLGMVQINEQSIVLADLPGLIENAHQGVGLGIRFLKHIERCKVFLHMVDLERDDPYDDYLKINHELEMYDDTLLERPQIIVANKTDVEGSDEKLERLKKNIPNQTIFAISALMKKDIDALMYHLLTVYQQAPMIEPKEDLDIKRYTLEDDQPDFTIEVDEEGVYELKGEKLRRLFDRTNFTREEAVKRFSRQLRSLGVDDALRQAGAKDKDVVRVFEFEFEFLDG